MGGDVANITGLEARLSTAEQKDEAIGYSTLWRGTFNAVMFRSAAVRRPCRSDLEPWSYYRRPSRAEPGPYYDPRVLGRRGAGARLDCTAGSTPTVPTIRAEKGHRKSIVRNARNWRGSGECVGSIRERGYAGPFLPGDRGCREGTTSTASTWTIISIHMATAASGRRHMEKYKGSFPADWRRDNVNRFITASMRDKEKPKVKFGLAPSASAAGMRVDLGFDGTASCMRRPLVQQGGSLEPRSLLAGQPRYASFPVLLGWWEKKT